MKHLNMFVTLVLVTTCLTSGYNLQAQDKDTYPSPSNNIVLDTEMPETFETPELVAATNAGTELNAEMARSAEFYTNLMWAVYCGTGEKNIRKSKAAYDMLIKQFERGDESSIVPDKVISPQDFSFVYTERATLRFNTLQNIKGAEEDIRKAIELNPESVQATWLLAQILVRYVYSTPENRNSARARALQEEMFAVLKRVIELDPDHHRAHYYLGTMARDIGQIELAITSFKALTRIMPYNDQFHSELGKLYQMQGLFEEALQSYERVVTILPQQVSARNRLGHLYLQTGNYPAAIKTFLVALTQLETQAGNQGTNSRIRNRAGVRAAREASDTEIEVHRGIGLAYQTQDNFEKAEFHIMRVLELLEKQAASIRSGTRRVRSAERVALTRSIQENRYTLGQIYLRFNMPRKAVEAFAKILATDANYVPALSGIGMAYQMLDDLKRAEVYLRKAIELSSEGELPDTYNALGYLYAEQGIKLDEAARLVQRALRSAPKSGAYLDSLGFIYFKQGKLDAAIKNLELALHYLPDTPEILLHLADAYLQKGLQEKALQTLEQAIRLEPNNAELRQKFDEFKAGK